MGSRRIESGGRNGAIRSPPNDAEEANTLGKLLGSQSRHLLELLSTNKGAQLTPFEHNTFRQRGAYPSHVSVMGLNGRVGDM